MTAYDAGTAFLQVVPSFRGVQQTIDAEVAKWNATIRKGLADAVPAAFREGSRAASAEGAKAGEQFGGSFARTVRTRIEAALKALPRVEINADSSDADLKIAAIRTELEDLHSRRIGIDIDEGLALAQLHRIQSELDRLSHDGATAEVRIDTARASAELERIQAEVNHLDGQTARVHVAVDSSGAGLPGIGGIGLLGAGVAAAPLAAPLGAAAVGGAAGLATLAGSGAGALGVLGLGLSNIKQAVTDIAAAHVAAGKAAAESGQQQVRQALAVASAERGLTSAQAGLRNARANAADAAVSAAERVEQALAAEGQAERNLTRAQQAQKDAQDALTAARKTAAEQLVDLQNAVADGALSQRQADLDVERARLHLQDVNGNALSTVMDRQQAQLDYDSAIQRQKDLAVSQQRLVDQQKAAAKAGVDGSAVVVQAQKNLVSANDAVTQAYTAQKAAAQGVSDALRAQATQARQSAYAIQQAENGVANALAAVQSAALASSSAAGTQLDELHGKLAALSPAALAFATFINNTLKPAFDTLRDAAQAGLLPGLQAGLSALLPVMPALTKFVGSLAKVMGDLFTEAGKALTSPFWQDFFAYVQGTAGETIETFAHTVGNLATAFAGLLEAFKPISDQIGRGIENLTAKFADWAKQLDSDSSFQSFLAYVKREGPAVAHFFGDLLRITGRLLEGLAPLGAVMLDLINQALDLVNALGPEGLLLSIGLVATVIAALGGPVTAIAVAVTALAGAAVYAYEHFKPLHDFINDKLAPVLSGVLQDALDGIRSAFKQVSGTVKDNHKELEQLAHGLGELVGFIVKYVLPIYGEQLKTTFKIVGVVISSAIWQVARMVDIFNSLWKTGVTAKNQIVSAFKAIEATLKVTKSAVGTIAHAMWDPLVNGFYAAMNGIIDAWNGIDFSIDVSVPGWVPKVGGKGWHSGDLFPDIAPLRRATGGPVMAGRPYWVGDGGTPELMVPGQSGTVLNLQQVAQAISAVAGGGSINHTEIATNAGPTIAGGYHQHFHERVRDQDSSHLAMLGHQRLMHTLSNR